MTERELRKLRRPELLRLLLEEQQENERLRGELAEAKDRLTDRTVRIGESGSIAEASLKVNHIFEAAQQSADQYLENIRRVSGEAEVQAAEMIRAAEERCEALDTETKKRCEALDAETRSRCEALDAETRSRCEALDEETKSRCGALDAETKASCDKRKQETEAAVKAQLEEAEERCSRMLRETEEKCRTLEEETRTSGDSARADAEGYVSRITAECGEMKLKAEREANAYWDDVTRKVTDYLGEHKGLMEQITGSAGDKD